MTSLHERTGFNSDLVDSAADDVQAAFILRDNEFDLQVFEPPDAATPSRASAFVRAAVNAFRGAFARSPKRPMPRRKHYPPRFGIEFETSLVDRERRRL